MRIGDVTVKAILGWRKQGLSRIESPRQQASEAVVHRFFQILLATEIALGGQYRGMSDRVANLVTSRRRSSISGRIVTPSHAIRHAASLGRNATPLSVQAKHAEDRGIRNPTFHPKPLIRN
jgi:hypothetical protein